ncbi:MAG: ATP-binding protein [Candidatus Tokpelaia hoelldobleri]|uniref:histidine kinase n=1 Tax=Candidatus Tokpelaia hoelldobleri TaxID=1902579 RepID=A0A1U9JW67_9HYPH|nr:MAG: ATP-binding protein [Candidatus Tokpelaia hoelldoblerii]
MRVEAAEKTLQDAELAEDMSAYASMQAKIPFYQRLRVKLIFFISLAVLITEILVFVPSIADMKDRWLETRHQAAQALGLAFVNKQGDLDGDDILHSTAFSVIRITRANGRTMTLSRKNPAPVTQVIDLRHSNEIASLWETLRILLLRDRRGAIEVVGALGGRDGVLSAIIPKTIVYQILLEFTGQFIAVSFTIAIIAALLIYLIIYELLMRPWGHIYDNMLEFVAEPHDPGRILVPEQRNDEVGLAQRRIAAVERVLQQNYVRQKHLVDLGLAVSKINHDMRNVLASAQLVSDHLAEIDNPVVQKLTPKLLRAISRAIRYSQSVIAYGHAQEQLPQKRRLGLRHLVDEVHESLAVAGKEQVELRNLVPENFEIDADSEQMHRVITNLIRNAVEAITADENRVDCAARRISISAGRIGATAVIDVEDTGPGLPARAKEHLFAPFQGSTRRDGIGLGLAICLELVRAHGGTIKLLEDGRPGTHFEIRLPDSGFKYGMV